MIYLAGEPDDMWWNGEVQEVYLGADLIWKSGPTIEVYDVDVSIPQFSSGKFFPLVILTPPPGEVWGILIEGTLSGNQFSRPSFRIGGARYASENGEVSYTGEITSTDSQVGLVAGSSHASFSGTVTVTIP